MSTWQLAPTLRVLRDEINERWPNRDKTSDGTIGNASHAAGASDHNPDARGVVCAIDIDEDLRGPTGPPPSFSSGTPAAGLVKELVDNAKAGDTPQLYYVIYERKIYSRTYDFRARDYTGPNAHDHHLHVSVYHTASLADRTDPWGIADMALSDSDTEKIAKLAAKLVWEADVIPNVWGDAKTNPNAKAKNAIAEIGRDANAIRDKLQA